MWVSAWCKINCFLISYHYEGCFCLTNSVGDGSGDSAYLRLLFDVMKRQLPPIAQSFPNDLN